MCSTTHAGYLPGFAGRKYSQCTVLLFASGVTTGDGNVTSETANRLAAGLRLLLEGKSLLRQSKRLRHRLRLVGDRHEFHFAAPNSWFVGCSSTNRQARGGKNEQNDAASE